MKLLSSKYLKQFVETLQENYQVTLKENRLIAVNNHQKKYCSIQIINKAAPPLKIANIYFHWLHQASKKFIIVSGNKNKYELSVCFFKKPLLILTLQKEDDHKAIYSISGGLLSNPQQAGTFSCFRYKETSIIALEHFQPRLPWWIYRATQAPIHEFVMIYFQKNKLPPTF